MFISFALATINAQPTPTLKTIQKSTFLSLKIAKKFLNKKYFGWKTDSVFRYSTT